MKKDYASHCPKLALEGRSVMEKPPVLHRIPFTVAGVMAGLSLGLTVFGLYRLEVVGDFDAPGLILVGILLLVSAGVIAIVYGMQEKLFRKTMRQPLMVYTLDAAYLSDMITKNTAEIQAQNKIMLLVMLFFCGLMALIFLFIGEEGPLVSLAMLGLAAFLSLMAWIITRYRTNKLKKGGRHVLISQDGVLFLGQYHTWSLPGGRLDQLSYDPSAEQGRPGMLTLVYSLPGRYSRTRQKIQMIVPPEYDEQAAQTLQLLRKKQMSR